MRQTATEFDANISVTGDVVLVGTAVRQAIASRAASGAGNALIVQAGGAAPGAADLAGGDAVISGGIATGTGNSGVQLLGARRAAASGSADNAPGILGYLANNGPNSNNSILTINQSLTFTGAPFSNAFLVSGQRVGGVGAFRITTANTAGSVFTVQAGGATSGATDKNGGALTLAGGIATGTGSSTVQLQTATPQASTSTSDNIPSTKATLTGTGLLRVGDNQLPTATVDIVASTTANASLRLRAGTAPTSPNDGDIWFDGANLKIRIGGVTKTVTVS